MRQVHPEERQPSTESLPNDEPQWFTTVVYFLTCITIGAGIAAALHITLDWLL